MKQQTIFFTIVFFAACSYFYISWQPQKKDASTLIVGTSADFYPFCFLDEQRNIVGYDIDVITQVAQRIGKKIQFADRPFNTLILELIGKQIDLIAAGTNPSEERKQHVLFTDPYLPSDPLVVLSKHPISSLDELLEKHIVTCTGYTADMYVSKLPTKHEIIRLKSPSEALLSLQSNVGDVFVTAKNPIQNFLTHHTDYYVWQIPETGETASFALHFDNQELCDQINAALAEMKNDGSLQALLEKWKIS